MRALAAAERLRLPEIPPPRIVVPIRALDAPALHALGYALSISQRVAVVHVPDGEEPAFVRKRLRNLGVAGRLEFVEPARGDPVDGVLDSIEALSDDEPHRPVAVVLAPLVPRERWLLPLHDQSDRLRKRLLTRPGTAVIDVRYHL
jgi:hypothetical protein